MPKKSDQFDVFLAHNSRDKPLVEAVKAALEAQGLRAWYDKDEIPPGRWFQDLIQQAIPKVGSAAIFIGPHGLGRWQAVEIRSFVAQCVDRGIPVIPVLLPGVDALPDHLVFLKELNWVQFRDTIEDQSAIDALVWGITGTRPAKGVTPAPSATKKPAKAPAGRTVSVGGSGEWVLLDGRFYCSQSCAHGANQIVTVEVLSQGTEDEAALKSLDPGQYHSGKAVMFAHANQAFDVRVQGLQSKATGKVMIWTLVLRPEARRSNSLYGTIIGGMGEKKVTPEQTAELRARRILLGEVPPSEENRGFPGLLESATKVADGPPLEPLFATAGRSPQVALCQARLALVYGLLASEVVERIQQLTLSLKLGKTLAVQFRGVRPTVYTNVPGAIVEVMGERTLDAN